MSIFKKHKTTADRSAYDRTRHRSKIEKAIKEGIHHIVAEESIIGKNGKKKFKIPVRGIKEYRFVYGENGSKQAGSGGDKDLKRGQKIGSKKQKGKGNKPDKAGNDKGEEFYEVELTLDELAHYLFNDLNLPNFQDKAKKIVTSKKIVRSGYRKKGIRPRLDKKKSVIEKIKRKKKKQFMGQKEEERFPFHESDLIYKHFKLKQKKHSSAVIFFIMDISGSMGKEKKYLSKSFFFILYQFIRSKYDKVELVFIAHDAYAYEVNEKNFFSRGSSGGTIVSSALEKVDEIINSRYHPSSWNIYAFQCSDGDNWPSDNERTVTMARKMLEYVSLFGYCEIEPIADAIKWIKNTSLQEAYKNLICPTFKVSRITKKEEIWKSFKHFFEGKG